jgi:hypothetical protein
MQQLNPDIILIYVWVLALQKPAFGTHEPLFTTTPVITTTPTVGLANLSGSRSGKLSDGSSSQALRKATVRL